jgi:hypothetical protein
MNGNESQSYEERNDREINIGELVFEACCWDRGWKFWPIGFKEKTDPVDFFYLYNPNLRNLPDYIVEAKKWRGVVCVKGTTKFKTEEREMMSKIASIYTNSATPLVYAFCFEPNEVHIMLATTVAKLYDESTKEGKMSDGKPYRIIKL